MQGSLRWKVFLFPFHSKHTLFTHATEQFFGLDLLDEVNGRTHWTHKPSVWENLFISIKDLARTGDVVPISDVFNGVLSCGVRAVPNGDNEIRIYMSARKQTIQHWIMLVPMPSDREYSEYIPEFLCQFQELYHKPYIQSAYKSGVEGITKSDAVMNQLTENGTYWHVLDNATEKEIIYESCRSLSEVLMDCAIKEVLFILFGAKKDPTTWNDTLKAYAYGP